MNIQENISGGITRMHYIFKLIIAGDGAVGKTTLVNRFVNGTFHEEFRLTVGIQLSAKRQMLNGDMIDLQIWDLGGQERYRFILPDYCKGAHGALFLYDTTSPTSLDHMDDWIKVLRSQGGTFPVVVGGTKIDLPDVRAVTKEEALDMASKFGISEVIEVSSKTGANVDALFESICTQMIRYYQQAHQELKPVAEVPSESTPRVN